jgi:hypothetical protein
MVVPLQVTALSLGKAFLGTSEVPGAASNRATVSASRPFRSASSSASGGFDE